MALWIESGRAISPYNAAMFRWNHRRVKGLADCNTLIRDLSLMMVPEHVTTTSKRRAKPNQWATRRTSIAAFIASAC